MMWRFKKSEKVSDVSSGKRWMKRQKFFSGEFTEESRYVKNPAQGWYSIYPFYVERKINPEELKWSLREDESVVLVLLDLSAYQKSPLDFFAIKNISEILQFFCEYHKDVILRPVYDQNGEGEKKEPENLERILEHIRQLGDILRSQKHTVFLFQGFLIGSWGEMHSSKYLSNHDLRNLYHCIRENLDETITLAVRTPAIWRKLIQKSDCEKGKYSRLTLFNDALFASATDLGTYGTMTEEAAGWTGKWNRLEELRFAEKITEKIPFGGEVVLGEKKSQETILKEMKKLHLTCLNSNHDLQLLERWKKESWIGNDCFCGKSFYDYVGTHMGARFVVRNVEAKYKRLSGKLKMTVEIENCGFGRFCQETELWLIIQNETERKELLTGSNLQDWGSGERRKLVCAVPGIKGEIYLQACRKKDKAMIRFANKIQCGQQKNPDCVFLGCLN